KKRNNIMNNTVKILIIVFVILVGLLGLTGGFILQGYFNNDNNNSTVNQSNESVNNTTTTSSGDKSDGNVDGTPIINNNVLPCPNCHSMDKLVIVGQYQKIILNKTRTYYIIHCNNCGYEFEEDDA
ncbi:MAG: hypothetical protein LLF83_06995, partial [Methanobacterium sp.]|nr:hypothetical protein [Methanobacterium sp.]